MAERSTLQYTPVVGPVWREPVASRLAWLPQDSYRGRARARALVAVTVLQVVLAPEYNPASLEWQPQGHKQPTPVELRRVGGFAHPPFEALYKPAGLEWQPADRYAGKPIAGSPQSRWVTDPVPIAGPAFDPRTLDWMPRGTYPRVPVERRVLGDFAQAPFEALYKPQHLQWQPSDRYAGRPLGFSPQSRWVTDPVPIPGPAFDPRGMQWLPMGTAPRVPVERRIVGDFAQPPFAALYRPDGIQWMPSDRYAGKPLPYSRQGAWVSDPVPIVVAFDPRGLQWLPMGTAPRVQVERRITGPFAQPPFQALYKPEQLQWLLKGQQPQRTIAFVHTGRWVIDPITPPDPYVFTKESARIGRVAIHDATERVGRTSAEDATERIGTGTAKASNKRIG